MHGRNKWPPLSQEDPSGIFRGYLITKQIQTETIEEKVIISIVAFPFDLLLSSGGYEQRTECIIYQKGVDI